MSVLETPRVYFRGEVSWDPVTTNNYQPNEAAAAYDEADCEATLNENPVRAKVTAFREAAAAEIVSAGNWNPQGTYRSPFYDTYVSGVDTGGGLDVDDPFVSAPVNFVGMLVDAEPYGAFSSQLFFDDMSFGIPGGCRIAGKRVTRISDRFINFSANPSNNMIAGVASVMWQTCFAKGDGLTIDAHDSGALQALLASMADPDVAGVMVRFTTYRTVYYDDLTLSNGSPATSQAGAKLQAQIAAGGFQPNPARSLLVGTVGLWRRTETLTEPSDRALVSTLATIPGYPTAAKGGPVVGTAFARVGPRSVTLDLSNSVPCANRQSDKIDMGELSLVAADPPPAVALTTVAKIPFKNYDRAAFEATSGIVELPLDAALAKSLAGMDLSLRGPDGTAYLVEAALRAIPTAPNLYVDQGQPAEATIQVYERGVPAKAGINVTMSDILATDAAHLSQTTDANGQARFKLDTSSGKIDGLAFQCGPAPTLPIGNAFNPLVQPYMYLRVLPLDDAIAALSPTWDNVHAHVLSNWEAMAPCMDNWLRLGDEAQVRAYGSVVKKLTDPANFESFRFMPITRDMTRGQRSLLYRFLGAGPTLAIAATAGVKPSDEHDVHRLSRAMRSH
jgi:hypothetical protein